VARPTQSIGARPAPRAARRLQSPAARRAIRAATPREPWLPPAFTIWVLGRVLAALLLVGAAWIIQDFSSSSRFQVRTVHVHGNVLLSQQEIDNTAAVLGANIFWVNRAAVASRLGTLPLVKHATIEISLPDTVDIQLVERQPVGFWASGGQTYLVDNEGVILRAVDAETAQIRACAGQLCDPAVGALPSVADTEPGTVAPGDRVDTSVLTSSAQLNSLLPSIGIHPTGFEWSRDSGLEVPTADGWRARFDQAGNLAQEVAELRAIRDELTRTRTSAGLIDVRFGDRSYFR
jgi:cell division protein FtsQ